MFGKKKQETVPIPSVQAKEEVIPSPFDIAKQEVKQQSTLYPGPELECQLLATINSNIVTVTKNQGVMAQAMIEGLKNIADKLDKLLEEVNK
jgi:hypothetical protein